MSVSVLPVHAATITSAQPSPTGALLMVSPSAPAGSPYLALTITRAGNDNAPDAGQALPPLHLSPDDLSALRTALDMVARAHAAMGKAGIGIVPGCSPAFRNKKPLENDKARHDLSRYRAFSYKVGTAGFEPATP